MTGAALFVGEVGHVRFKPARHALKYRVFMCLFDLDDMPRAAGFGYNRGGLMSFYDRDHGDGSGRALKPQIAEALRAAGLNFELGGVRILCMPRVLNYVFNPLSVYFCYDQGGALAALVHEVNNTFGERHLYALPADEGAEVRQDCEKTFRVSPFLPMQMRYEFAIRPPTDEVSVSIVAKDAQGPMLSAWFKGRRRAFNGANVARAWLTHPAMTLKVLLGIHWEALFIWLKLKRATRVAHAR